MKRSIVCIKPVPDPKHWHKVAMDEKTQTLIRKGIPSIINPLDKHALEAALTLKASQGGEVVLLSMAPPYFDTLIREGLAMGADRALLLSDPLFAGSDTLATARILAAGCQFIGDFDLVLCGNSSLDGSTAQIASQLGVMLHLPSIMHVIQLDYLDRGKAIVTQKIEHGHVKFKTSGPMVISVRKELNKPRYTSFTGILAAENKEIQVVTNAELLVDQTLIGLAGSPTKMAGMELRTFSRKKEKLDGTSDEIVQKLVERIYQYGVI